MLQTSASHEPISMVTSQRSTNKYVIPREVVGSVLQLSVLQSFLYSTGNCLTSEGTKPTQQTQSGASNLLQLPPPDSYATLQHTSFILIILNRQTAVQIHFNPKMHKTRKSLTFPMTSLERKRWDESAVCS